VWRACARIRKLRHRTRRARWAPRCRPPDPARTQLCGPLTGRSRMPNSAVISGRSDHRLTCNARCMAKVNGRNPAIDEGTEN
jgi:hypothetical protein